MKPGIYEDMPGSDYHGNHESYSKTSISDFSVYPKNLKYQRSVPRDPSKFWIGQAAHVAILEPDKWDESVSVIPDNVLGKGGAKNTNAYREWLSEQPADKAIISSAEKDTIEAMHRSLFEDPYHSHAAELLTGGKPEVSCFWEEQFKGMHADEITGYGYMESHQYGDPDGCHILNLKCRPDYIPADGILVDLKTTKTRIDLDSVERHFYDLKYHWSSAMSTRGMSEITRKPWHTYIFVVVEVAAPHEVAVFPANRDMFNVGRIEFMHHLQRLAYCDKTGIWPGAPNKYQPVGVPGHIMNKINRGVI